MAPVGSRLRRPGRRTASYVALGALLLSLPGCGNRLAKTELLADNAGSTQFTQSGTSTAPVTGAASTPGGPASSNATAAAPAAPAAAGAGTPATTGTGTVTGKSSTTSNSAPAAKPNSATAPSVVGAGTGQAACAGPKSEIAIGTVGGQSGFIGASLRGGVDAIKAWVADINAKGGLYCHPIRYYVADDDSDPSKNAALTQQMVQDRHVVAMLYSNNPLSAMGGKPILERAHVPTIGSEGGDEYFNTSPDFFPLAATGTKLFEAEYGMLHEVLTPEQQQHLGVLVCLEASVCSSFGGANGAKAAEGYGMRVVYTGSSTMVQPDYTSNCQSAKNAGVQALFTVGEGGFTSRIIRSCAKIGFKPQFATAPIGLAPGIVNLPELDGIMLGGMAVPWLSDHPLAKRYLSTLQRYLPGVLPGGAGSIGWAAAMMFEKVGAGFPDNPTAQDVYNGLYKIKNFDFDGYTAPLTYAKNKPAVYPACWWSMTIRNKQWLSVNGNTRACKT
jgi:ABC-type branched-subunit amino acid transport system substrate-binding protein